MSLNMLHNTPSIFPHTKWENRGHFHIFLIHWFHTCPNTTLYEKPPQHMAVEKDAHQAPSRIHRISYMNFYINLCSIFNIKPLRASIVKGVKKVKFILCFIIGEKINCRAWFISHVRIWKLTKIISLNVCNNCIIKLNLLDSCHYHHY